MTCDFLLLRDGLYNFNKSVEFLSVTRLDNKV